MLDSLVSSAQARVRTLGADAQDLHLDRLQNAHLVRLLEPVRGAELERHLALVEHAMAARQARVRLRERRGIHRRLQRRDQIHGPEEENR